MDGPHFPNTLRSKNEHKRALMQPFKNILKIVQIDKVVTELRGQKTG